GGDRRLPLREQPQSEQVGLAEPARGRDDLRREGGGPDGIVPAESVEDGRDEDEPASGAVSLRGEPLGARQPPARPSDLTAQEQEDAQPERGPRRTVVVAG